MNIFTGHRVAHDVAFYFNSLPCIDVGQQLNVCAPVLPMGLDSQKCGIVMLTHTDKHYLINLATCIKSRSRIFPTIQQTSDDLNITAACIKMIYIYIVTIT